MKTQRNKTDLLMALALVLIAVLLAVPAYGGKLTEKIKALSESRSSQRSAPAPAPARSAPQQQRIQAPSPAPVASQSQRIQTPSVTPRQQVESPRASASPRSAQPASSAPMVSIKSSSITNNKSASSTKQAISRPAEQANPKSSTASAPRINVIVERLTERVRSAATNSKGRTAPSAEPQAQPAVPQQRSGGSTEQKVLTRDSVLSRFVEIRKQSSAATKRSPAATDDTSRPVVDKSVPMGNTKNLSSATGPVSKTGAPKPKIEVLIDRLVERGRAIQEQKSGRGDSNQDALTGSGKTSPGQSSPKTHGIVTDITKQHGDSTDGSPGKQKSTLLETLRQRIDKSSTKQKQPTKANADTTEVKPNETVKHASRDKSDVLDRWPKLRQLVEQRRAKDAVHNGADKVQTVPNVGDATKRTQDDKTLGSRIRNLVEQKHRKIVNDKIINDFPGQMHRDKNAPDRSYDRVVYHDRPERIEHTQHPLYTYVDHNARVCHRIIWPDFHFFVRYNYGPQCAFGNVYPFYHRKYIFVSLGGYWPIDYSYVRYYWYGWHPYLWYGYYPTPVEVPTATNNYYTYNYYSSDQSGTTAGSEQYQSTQATTDNYITPVDQNTFADVRERLAQQAAKLPASQTQADTLFEEAVRAFEADEYGIAVQQLSSAMELAPEDMVLPFAYSQALFANRQYAESAEALRQALLKVPVDKQGVFYPRGLYSNDDMLYEHIQRLLDEVEDYSYDGDLQLLLGYHLLGIGETTLAAAPLTQASQDMKNAEAAKVLLNILEKINTESQTSSVSGGTDTQVESAEE